MPMRLRRYNFTIGLFLGVLGMLGWQYWRSAQQNSTRLMPPDEAAFVKIFVQSRAAWVSAPNDLARIGMRQARAAALCKADPGLLANDWLGHIISVVPNTVPDLAGKQSATIVIGLNADVSVATPSLPLLNNPASMVEAGTPIYATAATLSVGQRVRFSGKFFTGGDCVDEESFTMNGGMTEPMLKIWLTALGRE
jgi:hypothetical protein